MRRLVAAAGLCSTMLMAPAVWASEPASQDLVLNLIPSSVPRWLPLATTGDGQPQQLQQRGRRRYALDADGDGQADDKDGVPGPDHWIEVGLKCASDCGKKVTAAQACFVLGPVYYFCLGAAAFLCLRDCDSAIEGSN
jgi:hypothetical protein